MDKNFFKIVRLALQEDVGKKDLTASLIPKDISSEAHIICKQKAIICGINFVNEVFRELDPKIKIKWLVKDGEEVSAKKVLCILNGSAKSLLTGERVSLNFLQTLSGTATLTNKFVVKLKGTKAKLLDTRKTIPGLRLAQKYAVKCGGGFNHRFGLYDAVLIKENHIVASGSIKKAISKAKKLYPRKNIEVEVKNIKELKEAVEARPAIIMLDNFTLKLIKEAVKIKRGKIKLEASGGVTLKNIKTIAKTGVDFISVGGITKSVVPVDLSMLFSV